MKKAKGLLRVKLNQCGTVRCEAGWEWHPRAGTMRDFDLWYVWAGKGEMRAEGKCLSLFPGVVFCLRPGGSYDATQDVVNRLGVCYLHFGLLSRGVMPPLHAVLEDAGFYEGVLRRAVLWAGDAERVAEAEGLVGVVLQAMESARGRKREVRGNPQVERVRELLRMVDQDPGAADSVEGMAERAACSPDHLARLCKEAVGMGPKEYVIRARVKRAQELLRETGMSVEQVAQALGYADIFSFSKQFKGRVGVSPSGWRETVG